MIVMNRVWLVLLLMALPFGGSWAGEHTRTLGMRASSASCATRCPQGVAQPAAASLCAKRSQHDACPPCCPPCTDLEPTQFGPHTVWGKGLCGARHTSI